MKTFSIDSDSNITLTSREGAPEGAEVFSSAKQLTALATAWPIERMAAIWNHLPGVKPVKKFKDRKTGAARIWEAVQKMAPAAPQAADVAPRKGKAKSATSPAAEPGSPREGSKKAVVLELLRRGGGASSAELMAATGWQAHSVRGFLSGQIGKKMGIAVNSTKREDGTRAYSIS